MCGPAVPGAASSLLAAAKGQVGSTCEDCLRWRPEAIKADVPALPDGKGDALPRHAHSDNHHRHRAVSRVRDSRALNACRKRKLVAPESFDQECHIINTASAAGLVVGGASAPYSVTKHGVVALSESLYLTLERQDALVKVSVLCPGLVHTNIINAEQNRPANLKNEPVEMSPAMRAGLEYFKAAMEAAMPPRQVADIVFDAIKNEKFYILTHPEWMEVIQMRTDNLLRMENPRDPTQLLMKLTKPGD